MVWTQPTATIWTASGMRTDKQSSVRKDRFQLLTWVCPPCCPHLNHSPLPADLMMGLTVTEDLYSIFSKEKEHEEKEKESQRGVQEQVSLLLQTYMQLLLPDDERFHGGWALINCDMRFVASWPGKYRSQWRFVQRLLYLWLPISLVDATNKDVDVLLLLSDKAYYIA